MIMKYFCFFRVKINTLIFSFKSAEFEIFIEYLSFLNL